jgi:serine/threonine protein kinase
MMCRALELTLLGIFETIWFFYWRGHCFRIIKQDPDTDYYGCLPPAPMLAAPSTPTKVELQTDGTADDEVLFDIIFQPPLEVLLDPATSVRGQVCPDSDANYSVVCGPFAICCNVNALANDRSELCESANGIPVPLCNSSQFVDHAKNIVKGAAVVVPTAGLRRGEWYRVSLEVDNDAQHWVRGNASLPFLIPAPTVEQHVARGVVGATASGLVLALVAALFCAIVFVQRRRYQLKLLEIIGTETFVDAFEQMKEDGLIIDTQSADQSGDCGPAIPREINRECLTLLTKLGEGNFGEVHKGLLDERGHLASASTSYSVAVKSVKKGTAEGEQDFVQEASITAQFRHVNVVALVGVVTAGSPLLMVLEFCDLGALDSFLKARVHENPDWSLGTNQFCAICRQTARGLAHLASKQFVHRDVAARNVLVAADFTFKIADFGLGKEMKNEDDGHYYRPAGDGDPLPVRWSSPEALQSQLFSQMSDVWAWGILGFEAFSGAAQPYTGHSNTVVWDMVMNGEYPPRPLKCTEDFWKTIIEPCFAMNAGERPTFDTIVTRIDIWQEDWNAEFGAANTPGRAGPYSHFPSRDSMSFPGHPASVASYLSLRKDSSLSNVRSGPTAQPSDFYLQPDSPTGHDNFYLLPNAPNDQSAGHPVVSQSTNRHELGELLEESSDFSGPLYLKSKEQVGRSDSYERPVPVASGHMRSGTGTASIGFPRAQRSSLDQSPNRGGDTRDENKDDYTVVQRSTSAVSGLYLKSKEPLQRSDSYEHPRPVVSATASPNLRAESDIRSGPAGGHRRSTSANPPLPWGEFELSEPNNVAPTQAGAPLQRAPSSSQSRMRRITNLGPSRGAAQQDPTVSAADESPFHFGSSVHTSAFLESLNVDPPSDDLYGWVAGGWV